ncbi:MAG: hypothetical protein AB4063_25025 [Crocosphaera sp.]
MVQSSQKIPSLQPKTEAEKLLITLVIDMKKDHKTKNAHMIVQNILNWVKPIQTKCLKLVCNLIRNLDNISQYENKEDFDKLISEKINPDNWYKITERDEIEHFEQIKSVILNSERSLDLLHLYQQILTKNNVSIDFNNTDVTPLEENQKTDGKQLIDLGIVISEMGTLKVSNKLYETAFNLKFINQELSANISNLVSQKWQNDLNLEANKQRVIDDIFKNLPPLAQRTDNLAWIIKQVLQYGKPSPLLIQSLLNLVFQNHLIFLGEEAEKNFQRFVKEHFIKNWQSERLSETKPELHHHYQDIREQLTNNKHCNSFWLLVTYREILQGKEIFFKDSEEEKELFRLNLIEHSPKNPNKFKVVNEIYKLTFNKNWVSYQLNEISDPHYQNLLLWLNSDNFPTHLTTLKEKFPNNLKEIMETIISGTHNHLDITEKIVNFIELNIPEVQSEDLEWFDNNIIFSQFLGTEQEKEKGYLIKKDFEILIGNLITDLDIEADKNKITPILRSLTNKFKRNPLIIVKEILSFTKKEQEPTLIVQLVNSILPDSSIIKTEDDVGKIKDLLQQIKNLNKEEFDMFDNSEQNDPKMSTEDLLNMIMKQGQNFIKAIIVADLREGEIVESIYNPISNFSNEEEKQKEQKEFECLFGTEKERNGGIAIDTLVDLQVKKVELDNLKNFSNPTGSGELKYEIYTFYERLVVSCSIDIQGDYYGLFYISKKNIGRNKFLNVCDQTIEQIRQTLQNDRDFNFV